MIGSISVATMWCDGTDAWSREARRVLGLAAARRLELDRETLALSDVRDLQAIRWRLETQEQPHGLRLWPWGGRKHERQPQAAA